MYQDKTLVCRDCGAEFMFTAGEQEFFAEKGYHDPVRCRECRNSKKNARREKVSYHAVCAECGKETEVPFIPKNDKPIYCSECYARMRNR
ncbi:MAG: zinc-ribbon domain containing protein [Clostridia bacterium]|nr:zinc-ribbon domain containing protein [Clostridia bacterium]